MIRLALEVGGLSAALAPSQPFKLPGQPLPCPLTQVKEDAWRGAYSMVYLTPELAIASKDRLLHLCTKGAGVSLLAIDEAHCVSEWWVWRRRSARGEGMLTTAGGMGGAGKDRSCDDF